MPDAFRSLTSRGAAAGCVLLLCAAPLYAQHEPLSNPPSTPQFLSRYDFRMAAAALSGDHERFRWDTHWRGEFDLVDYVRGRMTFLGDYQAVLGNEFRPFDPYQSNYTLAVSGSLRFGPTELIGVIHHVSRHLGDRVKKRPDGSDETIAINVLVGRVLRRIRAGATEVDVRAEIGRVIERAYMDYTWNTVADVTARRAVTDRTAVYARGILELLGVDREIAERGRQHGHRIEAGVRVFGTRAALELFGGYERVIDADPLDRLPRNWGFAGFRLLNQ
jgi:hypothetical protein